MQNKKLIQFVQSLVLLPVVAMPLSPLGGIAQAGYQVATTTPTVLSQKLNTGAPGLVAINEGTNQQPQIAQAAQVAADAAKAQAIDAYFTAHDMPLAGSGATMVSEAEKNGLDWRLLAAIAVRESTGGKHGCTSVKNNPFGWGSCKIGFKSTEEAIATVALNLGGNNPATAMHYDNKTTKQILQAYNPPSVIPRYAPQVMNIMDNIGDADSTTAPSTDLAVNS